MKLHFRLLTNKYFFIGFIIFLVGILTAINNYYFYGHVKRSSERNAYQLKSILKSEIEFCRNNRISGKRYRKHIETIVKQFSQKAYYNNALILKHETRGILWEKPTFDWDHVVASNIEIVIPKLKSNDSMFYRVKVGFNFPAYLNSILRSMTFSIFDKGVKVFHKSDISIKDRAIFDKLENKQEVYYKKLDKLNQSYKNFPMSSEQIQEHKEKKDSLSQYNLSKEESEKLYSLKKKTKGELSSYDLYIAWLRSRPAIGFTIFTVILIWLFRRRELDILKTEKEKEILKTASEMIEDNDDMELFEAIMNNDMSKLKILNLLIQL